MIVLSHRGLSRAPEERNRAMAFARSFNAGFGTETDVRDRGGRLVIAHDMASEDDLSLDDLLAILGDRRLPLAVNIKADGLGPALAARLGGRCGWFSFDMSVPEMVVQLRLGLPVFSRASEHERAPACYDQVGGIWLDDFGAGWFGPRDVAAFLRDGKQVCVVSPELHGRDPARVWNMLRDAAFADHPALLLCTDRPVEAAAFFAVVGAVAA